MGKNPMRAGSPVAREDHCHVLGTQHGKEEGAAGEERLGMWATLHKGGWWCCCWSAVCHSISGLCALTTSGASVSNYLQKCLCTKGT